MKDRASETTGAHPLYVIEVSSIEETVKLVEGNGGKLLKAPYEVEGNLYAVIEDSEGNGMYLWQTPDTVTWLEPESRSN